MISVCCGIKNRSESLINNLIDSINKCKNKEQLILSVFDCGSSNGLIEIIRKHWRGNLIFNSEDVSFSRSYAFNRAIEQSKSDLFFIADADITLPVNFVEQFYKNVDKNKTWFPIVFSLTKGVPREINEKVGWFRVNGTGMVGFHRKNFPGFNEDFKDWGAEDGDLYERTKSIKIRKKCIGMYHNYHFSLHNMRTTPKHLRYTECKNRIITCITTYNRIDFLKKCIVSWNKTCNKAYEHVLVIADDGSNDGTIEYLRKLKIKGVYIHFILNYRMGVHYNTNEILKYCSQIGYEYGFKTDDDILFLKSGWDKAYIRAIKETHYDHLVFYDENWRPEIIHWEKKYKSLKSVVSSSEIQGAFWTFTPMVIFRVGYFDIENFGFCGIGHQDYSCRCARAGFNDINYIYDISDSNYYLKLPRNNYKPAMLDIKRYSFNPPEVLKYKKAKLKENRIFIPYRDSRDLIEELKNGLEINKPLKINSIKKIKRKFYCPLGYEEIQSGNGYAVYKRKE